MRISHLVGLLDSFQLPLPSLNLCPADNTQTLLKVGDACVAEFVYPMDVVDWVATHGRKGFAFD
jgi:hypothetical protein